jgi:hypothetical protein
MSAQVQEQNIRLPEVCSCGHATPITDVRYPLYCCSNCALHWNGARWELLLLGVLAGAGLLPGLNT